MERENVDRENFRGITPGRALSGGKSAVTIAFYRRFADVSGITKRDMKRSYIAVGTAVLRAFRKFRNG